MHIRCPHCHNPIELVDNIAFSDIDCPSCGSHFGIAANDPDETIGLRSQEVQTVAHFELLEKIGAGAFGAVWKARDKDLDRVVAMKIPRKGQINIDETEKFLREARAAAQLTHPNIVSVHEVGRDGQTVFIVSELVDGITLSDWLTGRRPTPREAAILCIKIAQALHHAHEKGVVHRDLKPSNVMIDCQGEPHLMDFGLAKREAGEITMTVEGQLLGTPAYMSPEQARGDAHTADRRTDIYALGVILFEMLTGEKPFRGNTRMLLYQVLTEEPPHPRKLNGNVPKDIETITLKCLEKTPGKRYQTGAELSRELERFLRNELILTRPVGKIGQFARWCRRNPTVAALAVCLTTLLLVLGIVGPIIAAHQAALKNEQSKLRSKAEEARQNERALRETAESARKETWRQLQHTTAMHLAAQSQLTSEESKELGLLLAIEAVDLTYRKGLPTFPVAEQALRDAFPTVGGHPLLHHPGNISPAAMSRDGRFLAIGSADQKVRVWNFENGTPPNTCRQLIGHKGAVTASSFAPDDRHLVTGGEDGQLLLWDVENSDLLTPLKKLIEDSAPIRSIATCRQVNVLVSSHSDGLVRIWDFTRIDQPLTTMGPTKCDDNVALSEDGNWLLTQGPTQSEIWKLNGKDFEPERILDVRTNLQILNTARFSPDGRWFAAIDLQNSARIWDLSSTDAAESVLELGERSTGATAIEFHPDSKLLVLGYQDGAISTWRLDAAERFTLQERWTAHSDAVKSICFGAAGKTLITGSNDKTARIWDLTEDSTVLSSRVLSGHESCVSSLTIDPSCQWLVTDSLCSARFWDLADGSGTWPARPIRLDEPVEIVSISPDNRWLVIAGKKKAFELRDIRNIPSLGPSVPLEGHEGSVNFIRISPDNRWLLSANRHHTFLWDLKSTALAKSSRSIPHIGLLDAEFWPDSQMLVTCGSDGEARLWHVDNIHRVGVSADPLHVFRHNSAGFCFVAIDPQGRWLTTNIDNMRGGELLLWSLSTPYSSEARTLAATDIGVNRQTTFSPDGKWLIAGNASESPLLRIWRLTGSDQPKMVTELPGLRSFTWHLGISPDSRWLFAASLDKSPCLWDLTADPIESSLVRLHGHEQPIRSFAFCGDSEFLVTAGIDRTVRVWRLGSIPKIDSIVLRGHSQDVYDVVVSPDGKWIISASADETIRAWDLPVKDLLGRARAATGRELTAEEKQRFGLVQ